MRRLLQRLNRPFSSKPALSYFSSKSHSMLEYKTISKQLRNTTESFGNDFAVYSDHENLRLTYGELLERTERMAAGLLSLGLEPKSRIGVYAPTSLDYYVVQLACSMCDMVLVNINPSYLVQELEYALNKVGCSVVMIVSRTKHTDFEKLLRQLIPELDSRVSAVSPLVSSRVPSLKHLVKIDGEPTKGYLTSADLLAEGTKEENLRLMREVEKRVQAEELTNIQFTSGTTGRPKATCLSHFNILNNGIHLAEHAGYSNEEKILCAVPLYHCFGMVMCNLAALSVGAEVIYPHAVFDAKTSLRVASEKKATRIYGVPTMFIEMINQKEKVGKEMDLGSVRGGVMAGSICPRPLMEKAREVLNCKELVIGYGMTETSPITFMTSTDDPLEKQVSTVGRLFPLAECKLVDEQGRVVGLGKNGEICTKGYMVMQGYWADEEATRKSIDKDGWMHTGDVGYFDEDGYLSISGRIKDMIDRGGEKVFPKEIEELLLRHPKIHNVQVFAFPDQRLGEEIFCWVKPKEGESVEGEELVRYCKDKLAHFKVPKYMKIVDEFPITVTGKPQKFKMTAAMVDEINSNPSLLDRYKIR